MDWGDDWNAPLDIRPSGWNYKDTSRTKKSGVKKYTPRTKKSGVKLSVPEKWGAFLVMNKDTLRYMFGMLDLVALRCLACTNSNFRDFVRQFLVDNSYKKEFIEKQRNELHQLKSKIDELLGKKYLFRPEKRS